MSLFCVNDSSNTLSKDASSSSTLRKKNEDPWTHRQFLKDSKLRVRERYWRPIVQETNQHQEGLRPSTPSVNQVPREATAIISKKWVCLPDAATWRKYLPVLAQLLTVADRKLDLVLLESVAELLDHRHQSRFDTSTAPNERSTVLKWVRQGLVRPFPDLSVRERPDPAAEEDEDEWDWMGYDSLSIEERARHALLRAGRLTVTSLEAVAASSSSHSTSSPPPSVWLVVSDEPSLQYYQGVALDEGVHVLKLRALVEQMLTDWNVTGDRRSKLMNALQSCDDEYIQRMQQQQQQPASSQLKSGGSSSAHAVPSLTPWTADQVREGLRNGSAGRGRLEVSKDNPREAFVTVSGHKQTYLIDKQRGHFQQAFHHDVVIVEVLPPDEWGRPTRRLVHHRDDDAEEDVVRGDDAALEHAVPPVPSARVVAIEKPSRRSVVATFLDLPKNSESHILVVPMDVRLPKIRIPARSFQSYLQQRLVIQVDGWEVGSNYPHGRCVEVLGPVGDLETEVRALLLENEVALDPFSTAALACLPPQGSQWTIPLEELNRRLDLRTSRLIFSVDPPGCQDIDDSMHAHILPNGDVEIGVHIADVTHFVKHNSPLDREAQVRGTTFYLVDRRFDMLPALLSSDLCSLHGRTDRLAVSAIWTMSSDLKHIKERVFGRTVIHNCAAMTYDQADNILQGKRPNRPGDVPPPPLTAGGPVDPSLEGRLRESLAILTSLARNLRQDRESLGGAVDLSSGDLGNELKFTLEGGQPVKVVPKADKEIHHTIAELMILANTSVAEKIYKAFPDSALLRIHRTVDEDRFSELREILDAYGIQFEGSSNASLAATLKKGRKSNSMVDALLKSFATRAMSEAQYVCTGDIEQVDQLSHYGLGLSKYTHFTSPIRRYADVVVHKQLLAALGLERRPSSGGLKDRNVPIDPIVSLPGSNVVSILQGEGLGGTDRGRDDYDDDENLLDSLIQGASEIALGSTTAAGNVSGQGSTTDHGQADETAIVPYQPAQVSEICEGLNLHNRLAKYSSSECQRLFLSLYFHRHVEVASAVIVKLRANGFLCYVPKFDLRLPVFLKDMSEQLQLDPRLLGLPADVGLPSSKGFDGSNARIITNGRCELMGEESMLVSAPPAPTNLFLRPLDVVTVQLSCENFDVRARVPPPRAFLVSQTSANTTVPSESGASGSNPTTTIDSFALKNREKVVGGQPRNDTPIAKEPSLFQRMADLTRRSRSSTKDSWPAKLRTEGPTRRPGGVAPNRTSHPVMEGRLVFGSFVNPDTRSARQEVAQTMAAVESAQRRANVMAQAARRSEYDTTTHMEKSTTSRQQRLAADKRNTRRSKAK